MMYVPVSQNTRTDLPFINGSNRMYQRGELYYFAYHLVMSVCLCIIGFVLATMTPQTPFN
jgi:hypothetical protein